MKARLPKGFNNGGSNTNIQKCRRKWTRLQKSLI